MLLNLGGGSNPSSTSCLLKKKLRFIAFAFAVTTCLTFILWPRSEVVETIQQDLTFNITVPSDVMCDGLDFGLLHRLEVSKLASFTQREIIAVQSDSGSQSAKIQRLDIPLLNANSKASNWTQLQERCFNSVPVVVQVPIAPKRADASHVDFGVATTMSRLNESLDAFSHWAGYTNTRIFALVEPGEGKTEVQAKAEELGINLYMTISGEEYNHRYFSLVGHLADNARENTRWSCIIDDDTFFPSMSALVDALHQYDDSKSVYLGSVSESIKQVGSFGIMAFGGAGVFLSRPLLDQLKPVHRSCQSMDITGDRKISYCIYKHTDTKLTVEHRLRQLDIGGDASGFFEAAREPPLSVHHWKSWFDVDMTKLSAVSEICGDSCILSKWYFSDKWILTNGFSIIHYSTDVDLEDNTMEHTWGGNYETFLHELGPLRSKDKKKFSYQLQDAIVEAGRVRQWYIHRDSYKGDRVIELVWRRG